MWMWSSWKPLCAALTWVKFDWILSLRLIRKRATLTMSAHRTLAVLWLCALLLAPLCPTVQSKRGGGGLGGFFKGRGKGAKKDGKDGAPAGNAPAPPPPPTKKSLFSPKQGLKLAGAAAAGAVGGYGLGSWGRPRLGGGHRGGKNDYKRDGHGANNGYRVKSSAPAPLGSGLLWTVGSAVVCLCVAWIRGL